MHALEALKKSMDDFDVIHNNMTITVVDLNGIIEDAIKYYKKRSEEELIQDVNVLLARQQLLRAVKYVKIKKSCGLIEAKQFVEKIRDKNNLRYSEIVKSMNSAV